MVPWLGALAVLLEEWDLIPSNYVAAHNYNSSSRDTMSSNRHTDRQNIDMHNVFF